MRLVIEGQPFLVHVAVWTCLAVFLVSFGAMLYAILLILTKTQAMTIKRDERALPYWERAARQNSRASSFLVRSEFKYLRQILFSAILGTFGSFGILLLIVRVFGERT